jgi:hypothetical protein
VNFFLVQEGLDLSFHRECGFCSVDECGNQWYHGRGGESFHAILSSLVEVDERFLVDSTNAEALLNFVKLDLTLGLILGSAQGPMRPLVID